MASTSIKPIELDGDSELRRIAEEVRATGEPRLLRVAGRDVALIVPIAPAEKVPTEEDIAAFRSAFGSWVGNVDIEKLKAEPTEEDIAAFESAAGGWKGIVDGEALKRQLREERGEVPRRGPSDR